MLIDLDLDAWITIVTLVAVMAALLFTRLRSDVVFLGAIGSQVFFSGYRNMCLDSPRERSMPCCA